MKFIAEYESEGGSFTELCGRYEVSRMTGYKWVERFEEEGVPGLWERSRAPHRVSHALSGVLEGLILAARQEHPTWGPRKLLARLKVTHPQLQWCAISTAGELLRRKGKTESRIYRRRSAPRLEALVSYTQANTVWCTDFKGWFRLGNGQRCEPWTLSDGWSRYLLRVTAMRRQELEPVCMDCRKSFAATTVGPLQGLGLGGCRSSRCGGSSWAFGPNGFVRPSRKRMGDMSECI